VVSNYRLQKEQRAGKSIVFENKRSLPAMKKDITVLYYYLDEFCKLYKEFEKIKLLPKNENSRNREGTMNIAELLTIVIYYHLGPCKNFKVYYLYYLPQHHKGCFKKLISYNRMVQLMPRLLVPLSIIMNFLKGEETGLYYVDSTKLQICHNKRNSSNKVFKGLAKMGKSSYGWFMGFKLHLIINNKGEFIAMKITKANISDVSVLDSLSKGLTGKIFGDKGYISSDVFNKLFRRGLRLFTGIRKTMKNKLLELNDKISLKKRSLIESSYNILKNVMDLEHTRHRSPINFLVNILSCVAAFSFTSLKSTSINNNLLIQN
jgi:hypothetical protein